MRAMRHTARHLALLLLAPLSTQCGTAPAPQANAVTGPFDSRGNYIEEWADQPDKWYKPAATNAKPKQKEEPLLAVSDPPPPPVEQPAEIAVVQPRPETAAPDPKPVVVKPKPKPKPKPAAKPKPKPKVVKYTVKKGDNLSKIARSNGVSLSALRRANRISGDIIRPGQVLTIPR